MTDINTIPPPTTPHPTSPHPTSPQHSLALSSRLLPPPFLSLDPPPHGRHANAAPPLMFLPACGCVVAVSPAVLRSSLCLRPPSTQCQPSGQSVFLPFSFSRGDLRSVAVRRVLTYFTRTLLFVVWPCDSELIFSLGEGLEVLSWR